MGYTTGFEAVQKIEEDSKALKVYRTMVGRVDCRDVLDYYGAQNVQPETSRGEIIHSCLLDRVDPHHSHGDLTPSASISNTKKAYVCHSYGGGSLLWLIEQMEGDRSKVGAVLRQFISGDPSSADDLLAEIDRMFSRGEEAAPVPYYNERVLNHWLAIHPYLTEGRGFDPEVLMKMSVGFDQRQNRIVIPHFFKGNLVGWQKRRLDDERWPQTAWIPKSETDPTLRPPEKYKNSTDFPKNVTLYNYDGSDKDKPVVVMESCPSVWRAMEYGLNAVSTFGAKVGDAQLRLLREYPEVVIFMDADDAGWLAAKRMAESLMYHTKTKVVVWDDPRDLADLTKEEALFAIKSAELAVFALIELDKRIPKKKR